MSHKLHKLSIPFLMEDLLHFVHWYQKRFSEDPQITDEIFAFIDAEWGGDEAAKNIIKAISENHIKYPEEGEPHEKETI